MSPPLLPGRASLLTDLLAALEQEGRLFVLRGPPGVGKSAILRALPASLGSRPIRVATGEETRGRSGALAALAQTAGIAATADDERVVLQRIVECLDAPGMLLVLDNLDGAWADWIEVLRDLFASSEHLSILLAAQRRTGLPEERVIPVAPLDPQTSTAVLRGAIQRLAPGTAITEREEQQLLQQADGLPLVLELLAARVAAIGVAPVVTSNEDGNVSGTALERFCEVIWRSLSAEEQAALGQLTVWRGPFEVGDALRVLDDGRPALLERLVESSLLQRQDSFLRFVPGARAFAAKASESSDGIRRARARQGQVLSERWPARADAPAFWSQAEARRAELLAAWRDAISEDPALAVRLAAVLDPLLVTQGPVALHREMLTETLRVAESAADPGGRIDLLYALGRLEGVRGLHRKALGPLRRALEEAERLGAAARIGWCAAALCFCLRPIGELEEARVAGEWSLQLARDTQDQRLAAMAEQALGSVAEAQGEPQQALEHHRRALAAARAAQAPRMEGIALANSGLVRQAMGELDRAAELLGQATEAFARAGDRLHGVRMEANLATVRILQGTVTSAVEGALRSALDQATELGDLDSELEAREGLLLAALRSGERMLAERRLEELEAVVRFSDDVRWPPRLVRLRDEWRSMPGQAAPRLRVSRDGRLVELAGVRHDFTRRGPLRRVLVGLVAQHLEKPGRALSAGEVQEIGWPGEKMRPASGAARVYMAVRRLRTLGLEPLLVTSDEGYALSREADVAWLM